MVLSIEMFMLPKVDGKSKVRLSSKQEQIRQLLAQISNSLSIRIQVQLQHQLIL